MERKKVGKKLRKLRGFRSIKEVTDAIGISASALSMYERGERTPCDTVKVKLAEYYKVPVTIFFN